MFAFRRIFYLVFLLPGILKAQSLWQAPSSAARLHNPLAGDSIAIREGKKIFMSLCASCHGRSGRGDVPAVQSWNPKPADLTSEQVQNQSDGALFWKISEGRGLMASYKNILTEHERWALVSYIRTLKKASPKKMSSTNPQESEGEIDVFPFTVLINAKTVHIMRPRGFGLNIQHRFGPAGWNKNLLTNFLGLDLAANVRIAFEIPYNRRLMFEIGRTRYGKIYDGGYKFLIIAQNKKHHRPVSIAIYQNLAIRTEKPPVYSPQATFTDGRPFAFKFIHRLAYDTQLMIARRFTDRFAAQVTMEYVWRNWIPYHSERPLKNVVWAIPFLMRYKIGVAQALSMEIMPNSQPGVFPVSFAYEVASSGNHIFQITITNTPYFLGQNIFTSPTIHYEKDGVMLGFNLIRYF